MKLTVKILTFALLLIGGSRSFAQGAPLTFGFDGQLLDNVNAPVIQPAVKFKVDIMDPSATCVLYSEEHTGVDLRYSEGRFSLKVGSKGVAGSNKVTGGNVIGGFVLENPGAAIDVAGCTGAVNFSPNSGRLLRVSYALTAADSYVAFDSDFQIAAVPYAMVADSIGGKRLPDLLQAKNDSATILNQVNLETIFSTTNFPRLTALISGAMPSFSGSRLTNVGAPTVAADATNKDYVDKSLGGKSLDITNVGPSVGNGNVLTWDSTAAKWVAVAPNTDGTALTNVNATRLAGRNVAAATVVNDQVLKFNATSSSWVPAPDLVGISGLTGDVSAAGAGTVSASINVGAVTTSKIADGAVNYAKIGTAASPGVFRLISTDGSTGNNLIPFQCATDGDSLKWTSGGWQCMSPPAPGSLPWQVSGSNVFSASGAKVGIGTTFPWSDFHVRASSGENMAFPMAGGLQIIGSPANGDGPGRLSLEGYSTAGAWVSMKGNTRIWHAGVGGTSNWPASVTPIPNDDVVGKYFIYDETNQQIRFSIDQAGNVGIGTTSPEAQFTVARIAANSFGDQRGSVSMVSAESTANGDSSQRISASNSFLRLTPFSNSYVNYGFLTGAEGAVKIGNTQTGSISNVTGQRGVIISDGGTISEGAGVEGGVDLTNMNAQPQGNIVGVRGRLNLNASNTVTSASAIQGMINVNGTGVVQNAYGARLLVSSPSTTLIQNGYGVYIENVTGVQNRFSLYASDANAPSYFAGKVGIGTTSPMAQLDVAGALVAGQLRSRDLPNITAIGASGLTVSVSGSPIAGMVVFSSPSALSIVAGAAIATVNFPTGMTSIPPYCVISPGTPATAGLQQIFVGSTGDSFSIRTAIAANITANVTYSWFYQCVTKM